MLESRNRGSCKKEFQGSEMRATDSPLLTHSHIHLHADEGVNTGCQGMPALPEDGGAARRGRCSLDLLRGGGDTEPHRNTRRLVVLT